MTALTVAGAACSASDPPVTAAAGSVTTHAATVEPSTTAPNDTTEPPDSTEPTDSNDPDATDPDTTDSTRRKLPTTPNASTPGRLAPGPILVVTLGDSLTEGGGDDDRHGYPERLQLSLDGSDRNGSVVVNLGLSGWSSTQLLEGQDDQPSQLSKALPEVRDAKSKGMPAVALVLIGSNDLWYLYANEAPTTPEEERADLANYRANLDELTAELVAAGAVVVLAINDDQSKRPVAADAAMRREAFPDISDAEVALMSAQAKRYAEVVREVAGERGALVVDFLEAGFFREPATLADDGNHPNAAGYDRMTEIWLAALEPLLG